MNNKTTQELDEELQTLSVRADAIADELKRRQAVELAWKAGKRVEHGRPGDPWNATAPWEGRSACSQELMWGIFDYRIVEDRPAAPEAVWIATDEVYHDMIVCFKTKAEAAKALPGTPADRIVEYRAAQPGGGGWEGDIWVSGDGRLADPRDRRGPNAMIRAGYRLIRVREVK